MKANDEIRTTARGEVMPLEILPDCPCQLCRDARPNPHDHTGLFKYSSMIMIVCPTCGNKRCPKATHHSHACTASNAPGQPGSSYR